jgi:ubiquinone/menaquinone biosynthesis C-methylase UbiE
MTLPTYAMNRSSFPEMYERWLVEPLSQPWVDTLLQRAGLAAGTRVLDLACGTGIVARLAKARLGDKGRVVGVDVSPQMLAVASAIAPSVEWREGNACALPFGKGETFDAIICQQGFQFFSDKPAAAREMRRILAPGGRTVMATWRPLEEIPLFRELHRVAERHLGPVVDQRHSFGDATTLEKLLADTGFHDIKLETLTRTIQFTDASVLLRMNTMALVGMSKASAALDDAKRAQLVAAIVEDSSKALAPFTSGEGLAFEISTNVATAAG